MRLPTTLATAASLLVLGAIPAAAQSGPGGLGSQTLGAGYSHMFWAYAIAWVLIFGWTVSIGRRLARVEKRLEE